MTLGVQITQEAATFSVTARDASGLDLCLFDGERETRFSMCRDGDLYRTTVPGIKPGQAYGYRAEGPWAPQQAHQFDVSKLLIDPYAVCLDRRFIYDPRLSERGVDTASLVPKALIVEPPLVALSPPLFVNGGMIYELNVRGFTMLHPEVPVSLRGTIAALAHPTVIAHLRKMRVNAIELMPVVAWIDERHLPPLGLRNAWGYNPVALMALDPVLAPGGIAELRDTVAVLHDAGIAVILDLVLNHTGESDALGPTLSMRGLDSRYYARAENGSMINDSGTGNTLNASESITRRLMLDTLRHFVRYCGVDGFRFDLATILARGPGFNPHAEVFSEIAQDPLLSDRVLIAEPWDTGPGGYQLGHFPGNWLEWNDRYRDDVRRFWRGDPGMTGALATRMMGSSDIFAGSHSRSVNFLASHDGLTLADITAYRERHNEANGENNRDGHSENYSWNNGAEGPTHDHEILAKRKMVTRAMLATLFASRGSIMLSAGDEFGRTQSGNNNAYAQDNETTWLNWQDRDLSLETYVAELSARRASKTAISDPSFLSSAEWRSLDGRQMTPTLWNDSQTTGFSVSYDSGFSVQVDLFSHAVKVSEVAVGQAEIA
jgi:glycogen operon protein